LAGDTQKNAWGRQRALISFARTVFVHPAGSGHATPDWERHPEQNRPGEPIRGRLKPNRVLVKDKWEVRLRNRRFR